MTFKANWEKTSARVKLPEELILEMLSTYYTGKNDIKSVVVIKGGCANINILVQFHDSDIPVILRVYLRDRNSAYKEQKISELLQGKVSVPKFYHVAEVSGYTFAIIEYIFGETLSDFLLRKRRDLITPDSQKFIGDKNDIMFKVGLILGDIAKVQFSNSGLFNQDLKIIEAISQNDIVDFCLESFNNNKVRSVLSASQIEKIITIFHENKELLPDGTEKNLVHADFDPANILVTEKNHQIEISGILDWEFAFSGSTLCDVANMLRYAHHMPKSYQDAFLQGLAEKGYNLPSRWQTVVNMLNILSLLDILQRSQDENMPNQIKDIQELINHILSEC